MRGCSECQWSQRQQQQESWRAKRLTYTIRVAFRPLLLLALSVAVASVRLLRRWQIRLHRYRRHKRLRARHARGKPRSSKSTSARDDGLFSSLTCASDPSPSRPHTVHRKDSKGNARITRSGPGCKKEVRLNVQEDEWGEVDRNICRGKPDSIADDSLGSRLNRPKGGRRAVS